MCSGEMTSMPSMPNTTRGETALRRLAASDRVSDSGERLSWSMTRLGPSPQNAVTVLCDRSKPRSSASEFQGEPASSSAKQKPCLPTWPSVARSMPPGAPPPMLRVTSWTARPMVELARLPWPRTLIPEFMPMATAMGICTRHGKMAEG